VATITTMAIIMATVMAAVVVIIIMTPILIIQTTPTTVFATAPQAFNRPTATAMVWAVYAGIITLHMPLLLCNGAGA